MQLAATLELRKHWRISALFVSVLMLAALAFAFNNDKLPSAEAAPSVSNETLLSPTRQISVDVSETSQALETTTSTVEPTTATTLPTIKLDPIEFDPVKNPSCSKEYNIAIDFNTLVLRAQTDKDTLSSEINKLTPLESAKFWIADRMPQDMVHASNTEFIEKLLRQVLRKQPSDTQVSFWTNRLDNGDARIDLTMELLELHPYNKAVRPFCDFAASRGGGVEAAPGIVYQETGIEHVVFVDLEKVVRTHATAESTGLQFTSDFAEENEMTVSINANWFTASGDLDGFVVSDGQHYGGDYNHDRHQQGDHDYTALFGFDKDHAVHTEWHGVTPGTPPADIVTAVSGHPSLTHKGELASAYDFALGENSLDEYTLVKPNAHSAIGVSEDGKVLIFAAVDGKAGEGYSALQMAQMMKRLGAHESTMLDGGGSTSLVVQGVEVTHSNHGRRVLANIGVQTGPWFE